MSPNTTTLTSYARETQRKHDPLTQTHRHKHRRRGTRSAKPSAPIAGIPDWPLVSEGASGAELARAGAAVIDQLVAARQWHILSKRSAVRHGTSLPLFLFYWFGIPCRVDGLTETAELASTVFGLVEGTNGVSAMADPSQKSVWLRNSLWNLYSLPWALFTKEERGWRVRSIAKRAVS